MSDTRAPASSPLAIPALVVGILGVASLALIRIPLQAAPAVFLGVVAIVLGHLALSKGAGRGRLLAMGGLVGGYLALAGAVVAIVLIAVR
ncbi:MULTISPECIES: hypothetical protein [unclassified Agrococcus]|uniref:hypothetical protein n=1 Tax=unclassified Agrococcus TaxID=2615065 RepID=UPI003606D139